MMDNLPKIIKSFSESDQVHNDFEQNNYVNCNICRNFSNILRVNHRKSKEHQKKMTEKFRSLKNQMKMLIQNSVLVHDEDWKKKKESFYCYFCDKSVEKHKISEGLMVESFGYTTHLASPEHEIAVKKYLKYHERKEKFDLFCMTEKQFNRFVDKIADSRDKYLTKLDLLNMKDIQTMREIEAQRKKLVEETVLETVSSCDVNPVIPDLQTSSTNNLNFSVPLPNNKPAEKLPPWLDEKEPKLSPVNISFTPVIGPTIESLAKHVAAQKKKGLPTKRLVAKAKPVGEYSPRWMPDFKGVWNKGKRKYLKSYGKRKV